MSRHTALSLVVLVGVLVPHANAQDRQIPTEIADYVEARNFIASFSTPNERVRLAAYASASAVWDSTGSERLTEIYRRMRQVRAAEVDVDPGMPMYGRRTPDAGVAPELLRIRRVRARGADEFVLGVMAYRLNSETNRRLVASYDDRRAVPSLDALRVQITRRKLQYWERIDGRWRRQKTELLYLDAGGR